jgi:type I restriction enzyme S subunit
MALIPEDSIELTNWESRSPANVTSGVYFEEGNVLLAKITPCLENGKQAYVHSIPGGWGYATTEVFPLSPELVTGPLLDLYLRDKAVRRLLASKMQGTTGRQRLPKDALMALPVPVPPVLEQRAIANVLRTVQRAKGATEQVIVAARELRRSASQQLLNPADHQTVALGEAATLISGGTPRTSNPDYWGGEIPWISSSSLTGFRLADSERRVTPAGAENGTRVVPAGTTLAVVRGMSLRKEWRVGITTADMAFGQDCKALVPRSKFDPEYFAYAVAAQEPAVLKMVDRSGHGTGRLSTERLKSVEIPAPPIEEQRFIAEALSAMDRKIAAEEARRDALATMFDSLLHDLMSARLRVADLTTEVS